MIGLMRGAGLAGFLAGLGFLFMPGNTRVDALELPATAAVAPVMTDARAKADSLTEDIILYNLFSTSRTFPPRRYAGSDAAGGDMRMESPDAGEPAPDAGFTPTLVGTAVSERPGESRVLLQIDPADPTPRLYSVGDRAGRYRVVSIEPRAVILAGPRGRVVLRLPEEEDNS
jgi:hypothetical protein